jgi:ligand-binding SRPBCC domain-containing protein
MRYTFHSEQWLPYAVDLVFAFFANPENLPRLMPTWQKARIEEATFVPPPPHPAPVASTSRRSIAAGAGTKLTISFRPFPYSPIRVPWEAEISEFVWNDHFCDRQLRGPFAYWLHCHHLQPEIRKDDSGAPISGTLLRDKVEYELPLGKLGEIANILFVVRQLRNTFKYRRDRTSELLPLFVTSAEKS